MRATPMMRNATPRINNGTLAASLTTTVTTPIIISNLGRAAPAHGIPSRLLRRITCAPKLGSRALVAECLWRRLEPLARSRRRRLRTRWRGVHFRSPIAQEFYSRYAGRPASPHPPSTPPSRWRQGARDRRTGRAQNTPLYAFRPASRRRRARDGGVVAPDL